MNEFSFGAAKVDIYGSEQEKNKTDFEKTALKKHILIEMFTLLEKPKMSNSKFAVYK